MSGDSSDRIAEADSAPMVLRQPTTDDYPGIAELYSRVWNEPLERHMANVGWAYGYAATSGASIVAAIGEHIIAARCALAWPLETRSGERIAAVQQHGTAVDPAYRYRGIFTELARRLNNSLVERGFSLVFNISTPASRAAHEKLGWRYQEGLRRHFTVGARSSGRLPSDVDVVEISTENLAEVVSWLANPLCREVRSEYRTRWSPSFLTWRLSRPNARYLLARNGDGHGLLCRSGELRGFEVLLVGAQFGPESSGRVAGSLLQALMRRSKNRIAVSIESDASIRGQTFGYRTFRDPRGTSLNLGVKALIDGGATTAGGLRALANWELSQIDHDNF